MTLDEVLDQMQDQDAIAVASQMWAEMDETDCETEEELALWKMACDLWNGLQDYLDAMEAYGVVFGNPNDTE